MRRTAPSPRTLASSLGPALIAALLAAVTVCGSGRTAQAGPETETVQLSLADARVLARRALATGDLGLARQLAETLLKADANDRTALLILAVAEPQLGRSEAGIAAGRQAYRLSRTSEERFEAARLTARAAFAAGSYTRAQIWLRRAATSAPTPQALALTARDYRLARSRNPLRVALRFNLGNSDNLNGGASGSLSTVDGIPVVGLLSPDAQALSGRYGWGDLQLSYTLSESPQHRTTAGLQIYARAAWLSAEAHGIAPMVENADLFQTFAELTATHSFTTGKTGTVVTFDGGLGMQTYGGEISSRQLRLGIGVQQRLGQSQVAGLRGEIELRKLGVDGTVAETATRLTASHATYFQNGSQLQFQLRGQTVQSERTNNQSYTLEGVASYDLGQPVGPLLIGVNLGVGLTRYPDYSMVLFDVPGGREDRRVFGSVDFTLDGYGYAGFVPVLTVTDSRTGSNVSRFERNEVAVQVGWRSSF